MAGDKFRRIAEQMARTRRPRRFRSAVDAGKVQDILQEMGFASPKIIGKAGSQGVVLTLGADGVNGSFENVERMFTG